MADAEAPHLAGNASTQPMGARKRRQPLEDVPSNLDARERKRVLNILAQRRYRRRKKDQTAELEKLVAGMGRHSRANVEYSTFWPYEPHSSSSPSSSSSRTTGGVDIPETTQDNDPYSSGLNMTTGEHFINMANLTIDPTMTLSLSSSEGSQSGPQQDLQALSLLQSNSNNDSQWWKDVSTFLQQDEVSSTSFSDDFLLSVSELDLLRAACDNAMRLKSVDRLFDLSATTVFFDADGATPPDTSWTSTLPPNLHPTTLQLTVPHHPVLDILPWPAVRNKLINMYTLPEAAWPRHPEDQEPCTLVRMIYDMEDGGVRVWGSDPTAEEGWEVEQSFVDAWWWALDQAVLRAANRRRMARSQRLLTVGPSKSA